MEITEKVTEEKPDDSQLDDLEKKLGNTLPRFYREFLKNTNGGRPKPRKFSFTTKDGTHENDNVHFFYSLYSGKIESLEESIDILKGRIPKDTLPIASDPFGNEILLRMEDQPTARYISGTMNWNWWVMRPLKSRHPWKVSSRA